MRDQSLLVAFVVMVAVVALCHGAPPDTSIKDNEIAVDEKFKPDPKIPKALDPRFNKMIMPGMKPPLDVLIDSSTAAPTKARKPSTAKDETSTIGEFEIIKLSTLLLLICLYVMTITTFSRKIAIVPLKNHQLEEDMLKDVAHADVGKSDHPIDDTDANYDEYYDVRILKFRVEFVFLIFTFSIHRKINKMNFLMRRMMISPMITMKQKQRLPMEIIRKLRMMTLRMSTLITRLMIRKTQMTTRKRICNLTQTNNS